MSEYLPYLTTLGAMVAFLFSMYQYIDTRRAAERNERFDQFCRVFEWVAGRASDGQLHSALYGHMRCS